MAVDTLTLVLNPGSASRKYALYRGPERLAALHYEWRDGQIVCSSSVDTQSQQLTTSIESLEQAIGSVEETFRALRVLGDKERIELAGVRVVAPSSFFLESHLISNDVIARLEHLQTIAPLHIGASLSEIKQTRKLLPHVPLVAVSDSAFHITKPDTAWNYGIDLETADAHDIKRFGYHGISAGAAARIATNLTGAERIVICHLGSGSSVTAVKHGKSIDNTMGYSPLEGLVMATRSGTLDILAADRLQQVQGVDHATLVQQLNTTSGLRGISGTSDDIRELLRREQESDYRAELALRMYVYGVQKAIGQMSAALGGIDALVFTATVGERSPIIRARILSQLAYLGFSIDLDTNDQTVAPSTVSSIHSWSKSKPIIVVPADEAGEIARIAQLFV